MHSAPTHSYTDRQTQWTLADACMMCSRPLLRVRAHGAVLENETCKTGNSPLILKKTLAVLKS